MNKTTVSIAPEFDGPHWHNQGAGHAYYWRCVECGWFTLSQSVHVKAHWDRLTQEHVDMLVKAGFTVEDSFIHPDKGFIQVLDPAHCSTGGGKRWMEYHPLKLRNAREVSRFLNERT